MSTAGYEHEQNLKKRSASSLSILKSQLLVMENQDPTLTVTKRARRVSWAERHSVKLFEIENGGSTVNGDQSVVQEINHETELQPRSVSPMSLCSNEQSTVGQEDVRTVISETAMSICRSEENVTVDAVDFTDDFINKFRTAKTSPDQESADQESFSNTKELHTLNTNKSISSSSIAVAEISEEKSVNVKRLWQSMQIQQDDEEDGDDMDISLNDCSSPAKPSHVVHNASSAENTTAMSLSIDCAAVVPISLKAVVDHVIEEEPVVSTAVKPKSIISTRSHRTEKDLLPDESPDVVKKKFKPSFDPVDVPPMENLHNAEESALSKSEYNCSSNVEMQKVTSIFPIDNVFTLPIDCESTIKELNEKMKCLLQNQLKKLKPKDKKLKAAIKNADVGKFDSTIQELWMACRRKAEVELMKLRSESLSNQSTALKNTESEFTNILSEYNSVTLYIGRKTELEKQNEALKDDMETLENLSQDDLDTYFRLKRKLDVNMPKFKAEKECCKLEQELEQKQIDIISAKRKLLAQFASTMKTSRNITKFCSFE